MYAIYTKYKTLICIRATYDSFITAVKLDFEEWKCTNFAPESSKIEEYLLDHCPVEFNILAIAQEEGRLESLIKDILGK